MNHGKCKVKLWISPINNLHSFSIFPLHNFGRVKYYNYALRCMLLFCIQGSCCVLVWQICECPASFYPFVSIKCLLQAESSQKRGNLRQTLENCVFVIVVALFCDVVQLHFDGLCQTGDLQDIIVFVFVRPLSSMSRKAKHLSCVCVCMLLCKLIVAICSLLSSLHGA